MKRIALLVQDLDSDYFNYMVEGAKLYCAQKDYELFIFIIRGKNWQHGIFDYQFYAAIKLVTKYNVDGIILATNTYLQYAPREKWAEYVNELNFLPLVSLGVELPGISSVVSENKAGLKKLLNHLYEVHGRRNFTLVIPENTSTDVLSRKEAFLEFLKDHNLPETENSCIFTSDYSYDKAKAEIRKICSGGKPWFDALICCSDDLAFGCIAALKEENIKVPEDISVTGFDNQERCNYSEPSLTSVDQQLEKLAYQAAWLVGHKIQKKNDDPAALSVSSIPVLRNSCGCTDVEITRNRFDEEIRLLNQKETVSKFHYFLQAMQASLSLTEFKSLLVQNLLQNGVNSCVICLYDEPVEYKRDEDFKIPETAKILIAYDEKGACPELESTVVQPEKGMIPAGFNFEKGKEIVVCSIFNTNFQYGYAVYTPGKIDSRMYELILSAAGIALATNRTLRLTDLEKDTDSMTGVLNRGGFIRKGQKIIEESLSKGKGGAIVFGDMDHLKRINDSLGHDAGDEAIKAEVAVLKEIFPENGIIGRMGGDEFAAILPGFDEEKFETLKNVLSEHTAAYNKSSGKPFTLSISLGLSLFDSGKNNLQELLKTADENQYREKRLHHQKEENPSIH